MCIGTVDAFGTAGPNTYNLIISGAGVLLKKVFTISFLGNIFAE